MVLKSASITCLLLGVALLTDCTEARGRGHGQGQGRGRGYWRNRQETTTEHPPTAPPVSSYARGDNTHYGAGVCKIAENIYQYHDRRPHLMAEL